MSRYFNDEEFTCHCCGALPSPGVDRRLVEILDCIRCKIGKPLNILSGYRCYANNAKVGGALNSQHLYGKAADVYSDGVSLDQIASLADSFGASGIGIYRSQGFVHIDTRGYEARWEE